MQYTALQEEAQTQQRSASHQAQSSQVYPHRVRNDSDFISWLYGVLLPISSKKMSAQHKVLLLETLEYERRGLVKDMEGYTRVNLKTLASYAGASDDTASKALKWLEEIGALSCKAKYETSEDGNIQKRIYIKSVPHVLKKLHEIAPEKRNHGGKRFTCSNCGEDDTEVIKTRHIHCKKCGHTALLDTKIVDSQGEREEIDEHSAWDDVLAGEEGHKQPDSPIPASCGTIYNYSPPPYMAATETNFSYPQVAGMEDDAILQCAAYLAEIIGDYDRHIYMAGKLDQKYSMAPRRATVKDMLKHLSGTRPCGGLLHHADDSTKALCFDGDYPSDLALLESAAMALSEAGYSPIIEYSPARGGHLWILFDERVQRLAAYHHVYQIAPSLAQIREAWPRGNYSGNNLRILGSRYIRTTTGDDGQPVAINAWCKLVSVADGEALHGEQRIPGQTAHFLLSHMTPASIVPAYEALPEPEQPAKRGAGGGAVNSSHSGLVELAENELDEQWKEKYSRAKFPVAFTPEQLSAWYNQTHDIRAMLPYDERTRKYYASYRDETEASVSIYDDDTFCDFGLQSPDGGYYTGNAIELLSLSKYGGNKQRCMQDVGRELRQKAIQAIENAALSGLALPSWVESIITDDGRALYERLSHREAQDSQAQPEHQAQQGGVNSYHQPGTLRPDLQSLYASQGWYHDDSSDTLIMQGLKWAFSGQPAREQLVSYWAQFTSLQKALKHNVSIPGLFTREKTGQMYQLNASGVFRVLKDAYSMKPSPERQQRLDEIRRAIAHK